MVEQKREQFVKYMFMAKATKSPVMRFLMYMLSNTDTKVVR